MLRAIKRDTAFEERLVLSSREQLLHYTICPGIFQAKVRKQ
jgi:hypothetical protein